MLGAMTLRRSQGGDFTLWKERASRAGFEVSNAGTRRFTGASIM